MVNSIAIVCLRLPSTATDCHQLSPTAIVCRRRSLITIVCLWWPSAIFDCRGTSPIDIRCLRLSSFAFYCLGLSLILIAYFRLTLIN